MKDQLFAGVVFTIMGVFLLISVPFGNRERIRKFVRDFFDDVERKRYEL